MTSRFSTLPHFIVFFLGLFCVSAQAAPTGLPAGNDITSFQLRSSDLGVERCIAPKATAVESGETETRLSVAPDVTCGPDHKYLWQVSTDHRIINMAYKGTADGEGILCLTRRHSEAVLTVSLETCLYRGNDAQSWMLDNEGQLFEADAKGKALKAAVIPGGADAMNATSIRGSFQWLKDYPPGPDYCYAVPWSECRVCGQFVETTNTCPLNSEPNDNPGGGSTPDPVTPPPAEEKPGPPTEPEGPKTEPPKTEDPSWAVSKKAAWFQLKQNRGYPDVCLDLVVQGSVTKVTQQLCSASSDSQQWAHDLATKAIYNKKLAANEEQGESLCLMRTTKDIVMAPCLDLNQRNSSQRWYFSRNWLRGVPWAALLSYTEDNANWVKQLVTNDYGEFVILPRYTECELVDGLCYDLPTGELKTVTPFYSN